MSKRVEKRTIVESDKIKTWRTFFLTSLKETLRKDEILIPNTGQRGEIHLPCYLATEKEENTIEEIDEFITLLILGIDDKESKCYECSGYEVNIRLPVNNRWVISKFGILRSWWKGITVNLYKSLAFNVDVNVEKDSTLSCRYLQFESLEFIGARRDINTAYIDDLEPTCDIILPYDVNLEEHDRITYCWGRRLIKTGNDFMFNRLLPFSPEAFYASVQIFSRDASYFKNFLVGKGIEFVVSETNYHFGTIGGSSDGKAVQVPRGRNEKFQKKCCRQELIDICMCLQKFIHVYAILWVSDWISYLAYLQESWKVDVIRNALKSIARLKEEGGRKFKKKNHV